MTIEKAPIWNAESAAARTIIRPHAGLQGVDWKELWTGRELLWHLAWRDIRVRYKQTLLGAGWAVFQPVTQMIVFSIFFGGLLQVSSEGYPYPLFSFAALVPWTFFAASLSGVSVSLVGNSSLLTKVYFPRLLIPLSNVLARLVDFCIALAVLFLMMVFYGAPVTMAVWLLPFFLLNAMVCALGVGLWLASVNVYFRDIQVLVPFLLSMWQFASPVVYSSSLLEGPWRIVYNLNPMAGVIAGFRYALLGAEAPDASVWVSAMVSLILLISGILVFQKTQRTMADIV